MAASVQFRPQNRDLGMVMREVDEDLAIFLGMRTAENDRNDLLLQESNEFDGSKGIEPDSEADIVPIAADDNLLSLEIETSDYSWFLTQPDPVLPHSVDADIQNFAAFQNEISNADCSPLKSKLENTVQESASATGTPLQLETISSSPKSSIVSSSRSSSSSGERKTSSRAPTPTARSSLPSKPKPSRASTPSSRATFPSSKPISASSRSSTPTRSASRSSTPSSRPSVTSKPASRSTTPTTRKPAATSSSASSNRGRKTGPTMPTNQFTSPVVKSKPSNTPSEMLSVSLNAPQNSKVSVQKRPASATRVRTNVSSSNGKPRQKSCSPPKTRVPIVSSTKIGSRILSRSRGYGNEGDDVNPVLMGTKMVDRVVNMRKLAPPKQDEYVPHDNPKKSSQENSGFGRSLSKKSLDMAIRHMDIRRSIPDKLRPGARSGSSKKNPTVGGVSESSLTSSCDSSK